MIRKPPWMHSSHNPHLMNMCLSSPQERKANFYGSVEHRPSGQDLSSVAEEEENSNRISPLKEVVSGPHNYLVEKAIHRI